MTRGYLEFPTLSHAVFSFAYSFPTRYIAQNMLDIVLIGDPILRQKAAVVEDISAPAVKKLIADMKEVLSDEKFGVAISAPQVGHSLRIFVVSGKVFAHVAGASENEEEEYPDEVFINPNVLKVSKKKRISNEGCLSVPGKYGTKVERPEKVTISYQDEMGKTHERGASDFLAQIFQHEIDHLEGILYIDHALEVIDVDENMRPINTDDDVGQMRQERQEYL